jgi:hypothetical protein
MAVQNLGQLCWQCRFLSMGFCGRMTPNGCAAPRQIMDLSRLGTGGRNLAKPEANQGRAGAGRPMPCRNPSSFCRVDRETRWIPAKEFRDMICLRPQADTQWRKAGSLCPQANIQWREGRSLCPQANLQCSLAVCLCARVNIPCSHPRMGCSHANKACPHSIQGKSGSIRAQSRLRKGVTHPRSASSETSTD